MLDWVTSGFSNLRGSACAVQQIAKVPYAIGWGQGIPGEARVTYRIGNRGRHREGDYQGVTVGGMAVGINVCTDLGEFP